MAEVGAPNRDTIIGAMVLVFSNSKLKNLVGTDALRSVLTGQYRDMVRAGTLQLQMVWDLLADQPGFIPKDAFPPLCVLKTWEKEMAVEVLMPTQLKQLGSTEVMAHASHCPVPKKDRLRLFGPEGQPGRAAATLAQISAASNATAGSNTSTRRPALEAVLGVVAIAGLGFGGYSLYDYTRGPQIKSFAVADIGGGLPGSSAKRLGSDVSVVITDAAWFKAPEDERRGSLEAALRELRSAEVSVLIVKDASGKTRASAQWLGDSDTVQIRFQ